MRYEPAIRTGSRETLIEELSGAVGGWLAFGKPTLSDDASVALAALRSGAAEATVGHVVYRVTAE